MSTKNKSFHHLWSSLDFSARLAALTTMLVVLTLPITISLSQTTTRTQSAAADFARLGCQPRPACLDDDHPCIIREPAAGWCPTGINSTPQLTVSPISLPTTNTHRPRLSTTSLPPAYLNQAYSTPINGQDIGTDTLTLTAQNLPSGFSLNSCQPSATSQFTQISCVLSGTTTTQTGTYPLRFTLTDLEGNQTTQTLNLQVVKQNWLRTRFRF